MTGPISIATPQTIHASAVAWQANGLLIVGPSGSGKSALALGLMALGATLIGDDRIDVSDRHGLPWLTAPEPLHGRIEARGLGLLNAAASDGGWLTLVADLGTIETERLPPYRTVDVLGHDVPLVHKVESAHFVSAVLQYLKAGRSA